jgi:RHS repeat-associated protein
VSQKEGNIIHLIDRGFTMHQHLDVFSLINMGGRVYDPVVGLFLSPDPYVQMPDNTQNLNRYAYCLNSPTMYVDPSGEFIHMIFGAVLGGVLNLISNDIAGNINNGWQRLGYFAIGAVAGALGAGIGAGVSSAISGGGFIAGLAGTSATASTGFLAGAAAGGSAATVSGFTTGFGNGLMQGQDFAQSLGSGVKDGLISGTIGAITGGIFGGIDALSRGRDFWSGSYQQYDLSLNHIAATDNDIMFDQYSFSNDATIVNADQYKVYYKPEDGVYGTKNYVSPGKYIKYPIDGVATSKYTNMVFKIPDGGRVKVLLGGDVKFTNGYGLYDILRLTNKAGWLPLSKLDNSWDMLFKLALSIK